ncbi:MAG: glycosyltransferase family 2 protein [Rubrobacteraceae bacterium]|nr:glycosyltransferase family 2 protein [Rubrobacteraceae bacterium]
MTAGARKVSVIIPTLNAGPGFEELLQKIRAQEGDFDVEVLVVDSGSTDGTDELARRYGATVHGVPRSEFNHGATRNLGISLAQGEYVVLTVQDAVPLDERWLTTMVENLERDKRVAGVYGRQVPHPGSSALTRVLVNSLATAGLERREQFAGGPERYREMPPTQRRRLAAFDNVSSCLRRSVWEEIPFEKTSFGEDIRWGKRVVEAGYKTVYEPRSVVFHSHERGALYDLRRYYVDQRVLLKLFGLELAPNLARLFLAIFRSSLHLYRLLRKDEELGDRGAPALVLLAVKYAVPAQVGTYLGARSGSLARLSPRAFGKLHRFLSKGI